MARPLKKTVDYFPHDCTHGQTMFIIEQKYGNDGYALWFKLLEILGQKENHFIDCNLPETWEFLQAKTRLLDEKLLDILNTLARLNAIDSELWAKKIIWSQHFIERVSSVYANRGQDLPVRPGVSISDNVISTVNNHISSPRSTQSKVKESKVKEMATESQQQLLNELHKLPQWGNSQVGEDLQWLVEFKEEFPAFWIPHIRGCRDYHSRKSKHTKGLWKSRLRNWMSHEREKQGSESPDKVAYQRL
jgi:hypothetical protein